MSNNVLNILNINVFFYNLFSDHKLVRKVYKVYKVRKVLKST